MSSEQTSVVPTAVSTLDERSIDRPSKRAHSLELFSLIAGDLLALLAAVGVSALLFESMGWIREAWSIPLFLAVQMTSIACYGLLVDPFMPAKTGGRAHFGRMIAAVTTGVAIFSVIGQSIRSDPVSLSQIVVLWALALVFLLVGRFLNRKLRLRLAKPEIALVIGNGRLARAVESGLGGEPGFSVLLADWSADGVLIGREDDKSNGLTSTRKGRELGALLFPQDVKRVVVAESSLSTEATRALLAHCDRHGIDVDFAARPCELWRNQVRFWSAGGVSFIGPRSVLASSADRFAKRSLDIGLSLFLLVLLFPLLLIIALAIRIDSPGSPLYRQSRVGLRGNIFMMWKFRTMTSGEADDESNGEASDVERKRPGHPRITPVGRVLRQTSMDELPQLWNVVRGDMSLVGPRPLPVYEHVAGENVDGKRLDVRPGLTGLWQVMGRSEIDFEERMLIDYTYARNRTFGWDLRILAQTCRAVISRRGAY